MTWITKQIMKQQMIKSSKEKNTQKHKFFSIFDILKVLKKKKNTRKKYYDRYSSLDTTYRQKLL